jgi:hypothetical protein
MATKMKKTTSKTITKRTTKVQAAAAKKKSGAGSQSVDAKAALLHIAALRNVIPGLKTLGQKSPRGLGTAATVPAKFLEAVAVTIDAEPEVGEKTSLTSDALRNVIASTAAQEPVAEALEATAREVRALIAQQRFKVGAPALHAYKYTEALAIATGRRDLQNFVDEMKTALGRSRGSNGKAAKGKGNAAVTASSPAE